MRRSRHFWLGLLILTFAAAPWGLRVLAQQASARSAATPAVSLAEAHDAWAHGDYVTALDAYLRLLQGADGDAHHDAIAEHTGELFTSFELTTDGRTPRFSPDGRLMAYETGLEVSRRTVIVRNDAAMKTVAELPGVAATFAPSGQTVAYLKLGDHPELAAADKALESAPLAGQNRNALIQALTYQVARHTSIAVRDLSTGQERIIATPDGLLKTGLTYAPDGRRLFFLGGSEGDETRNDIYVVTDSQPATRVGDGDGLKGVPVIDAAGTTLLYIVPTVNPLRRPPAPGTSSPPPQPRGPAFGLVDLSANRTRTIAGSAPSYAADGRTLAYVAREGDAHVLMVGPPNGAHAAVKKTTERLDAPALSPDGRRLAYQVMARDDWEIHIAAADGSGEYRLTRDNQHDVLPRFVTADRLLAVVGEARHRRSLMYDLAAGTRTRLFHNNTVRTIAPEYQWSFTADGTRLLVGAERDGNTVSPERGVYLLDLTRKVSRDELTRRLRDNLAAETTLRAGAEKTFAPIGQLVRRIVDAVSTARIYSYEKALFDFDSKHITQPGNQRAGEYLFETYKAFGYEPEYQWFENRTAHGGRTANVIATLKGTTNPELVYVVSSHYDSVAAGPGADDNSSGTAALLEAARVLARTPMPATIVFASFTGEESGLLGSREFVRRAVESQTRIVGALNNDMIGWANDQRLDNTIRYSNPGIRDVQHGAAMLFTRLITYDALYFKSTDAAAYYDAYGDIVGGIGSHPVLSNPHYHQPHDFLEFINHQLVAETSKTTVATLMLLASSPSRLVDVKVESRTATATTVSWRSSPEKGVTSYVVAYARPGAAPARLVVKTPRATLPAVAPGTEIAVKAVTAQGLEGWDWARVIAP
jgi:Tol biopolymer transport system component